MNNQTYIFGHKNPDTDSICAAIAYEYYKRSTGDANVVATRLGPINRETRFALEKFGVKEPMLINNIKPQVLDMNYYQIKPIYTVNSIKKAWDSMAEQGRIITPVLNQDHSLAGVITITDIAKYYIGLTENTVLREMQTPFVNIVGVLEGKVICGDYIDPYVQGDLYTIAELRAGEKLTDTDIILTGNNEKLIHASIETGAGCVIITDVDMDKLNVNVPKHIECAIMCVPHNFFKAVKLINQSIPIKNIIKNNKIVYFGTEDTIDEVKDVMLVSPYRHFPIVNKQGEVEGVISKRHILDMKKKKVILVDHNENTQSAQGIEQAEILEIIDHHRIANIDTQTPVYLRAEPVGCTCTIIAKMYNEANIMPPREIAGLMLSAILSDTLCFKSPTCTEEDRKIATKLAKIAEVDLIEYGTELISTGGALDKISPIEILEGDVKIFTTDEHKISISQVNTTCLKSLDRIKSALVEEMDKYQQNKDLDLVVVIVTDILLGGSTIIVVGADKKYADQAFGIEADKDSIYLQGVCSRKKQVLPRLMQALQNI
ncbi:MAG: pyrophosphatase [Epulopiscium sp. Nuni2H_MBin003]|nr:MAG: pyrophosphatase [Epulopiscium sp. Nuni2H_MBin003]